MSAERYLCSKGYVGGVMGPVGIRGEWVVLASEYDKAEERIKELEEALADYGEHDRDCVAGQWREGRNTGDGGYETLFGYGSQAKWYPRGERPKCTCGLEAAFSRPEGLNSLDQAQERR